MSTETLKTENEQLLQLVSENSAKLEQISQQLNQLLARFEDASVSEDFSRLGSKQAASDQDSHSPSGLASKLEELAALKELSSTTENLSAKEKSEVSEEVVSEELVILEQQSNPKPTEDPQPEPEQTAAVTDSSNADDEIDESLSFLASLVNKTEDDNETDAAEQDQENSNDAVVSDATTTASEEPTAGIQSDANSDETTGTLARSDTEESIESIRSMLAGLLEESNSDEAEQDDAELNSDPESTSVAESSQPTNDDAANTSDVSSEEDSEFAGVTSFLDSYSTEDSSEENPGSEETAAEQTAEQESETPTPTVSEEEPQEKKQPEQVQEQVQEQEPEQESTSVQSDDIELSGSDDTRDLDDDGIEAMRKELEEKLRKAEIEMSIERARISQKAAELEEQQLILDRKERAMQNAESNDVGDTQENRWSRHMSASRKKD